MTEAEENLAYWEMVSQHIGKAVMAGGEVVSFCSIHGDVLVCRCGQTQSTFGWPCTHGSCLFECPKCEQEKL